MIKREAWKWLSSEFWYLEVSLQLQTLINLMNYYFYWLFPQEHYTLQLLRNMMFFHKSYTLPLLVSNLHISNLSEMWWMTEILQPSISKSYSTTISSHRGLLIRVLKGLQKWENNSFWAVWTDQVCSKFN